MRIVLFVAFRLAFAGSTYFFVGDASRVRSPMLSSPPTGLVPRFSSAVPRKVPFVVVQSARDAAPLAREFSPRAAVVALLAGAFSALRKMSEPASRISSSGIGRRGTHASPRLAGPAAGCAPRSAVRMQLPDEGGTTESPSAERRSDASADSSDPIDPKQAIAELGSLVTQIQEVWTEGRNWSLEERASRRRDIVTSYVRVFAPAVAFSGVQLGITFAVFAFVLGGFFL